MTDHDTAAFETALQRRIDLKTKPKGALGQIEVLAAQVARVQNSLSPRMQTCRLTIFAADHGIAAEGVSAYPSAVTRQMVLNFAQGGAAANVFCAVGGLGLDVVNAGVIGGPFDHDAIRDLPLGEGTESFLAGPAMAPALVETALARGAEIGREGNLDAVAFGEMGIGNSASAAMLTHVLTGADLEMVTGPGTGLDATGLARKRAILQKARARAPGPMSAPEALSEFGGFEIAMMAGAVIGAAAAGRVVLVDGFIATAAALAATRIAPESRAAMIFCHLSEEPGHRVLLSALAARPLLDLDMRLGEGTGAALAWPLLRTAVAMLNDMASFEDAGVSGPV